MTRFALPMAFGAEVAVLTEAHQDGRTRELFEKLGDALSKREDHQPLAETGPPASIRWLTTPALGFPARPFRVYRRPFSGGGLTLLKLSTATTTVNPGRRELVLWAQGLMVAVQADLVPEPGSSLTVEALDPNLQPIVGQRATRTGAGNVTLIAGGIAALRVSGAGTIANVQGISLHEIVNLADWQLIDTVGLPFEDGAVDPSTYEPAPQGYHPAALTGPEAAELRLTIDGMLRMPPPSIGLAGVLTPDLPPPDPAGYLDQLNQTTLKLIAECLDATDPTDLAGGHGSFLHPETVPGFHQPGLSSAVDTAALTVPVAGTTMVAVSADSPAATGLGYGTIDLPPVRSNEGPSFAATNPAVGWMYLVAGDFRLPIRGAIELAAFVSAAPPPSPAGSLRATRFGDNRPLAVDQAGTESVALTWRHPVRPQSYVIGSAPGPGPLDVRNDERPAGGFEPHVPPLRPAVDGEPSAEPVVYTDPDVPVPLDGTATIAYAVVGADAMGRWSAWTTVAHALAAPPVQQPGLRAITFEPDDGSVAPMIPARARIDVAWDWADRRPDRIELHGRSVAPAVNLETLSITDFPGATGPLVVSFDPAGDPIIDSAHAATVVRVDDPPVPGDLQLYRVEVSGLSAEFTTAAEVGFAVAAVGFERVRPTRASAPAGPVIAIAADPRPPVVPSFPVDITWTALPDAAGVARAVLRWPRSPNALGYVLSRATESAARRAVDPAAEGPARGTPVIERATAIRDLIVDSPTNQARSLRAFSRVQEELIPGTEIEIEVPGDAASLTLYRVSAVSSANVESARSPSFAIVAVPTLNQPGPPTVMLRQQSSGPTGIDVHVLAGPGSPPAGHAIHRTQGSATSVGAMGPAVIAPDDPGWADSSLPSGVGPPQPTRVVFDEVEPSWRPYHYRAVAVGIHAPDAGEIGAESVPSGAASALVAPPPPTVEVTSPVAVGTALTFEVTTSLPLFATTAGPATLTVDRTLRRTGSERPDRRSVVVNVAEVPAAPGAPDDLVVLVDETPGAARFRVSLPPLDPGDRSLGGAVMATDPLGRTARVTFSEPTTP